MRTVAKRWLSAVVIGSAGLLACAGVARADEFIDKVNGLYRQITPDKRTDSVLFLLLLKMQEPPVKIGDPLFPALLPPTSADFAKLSAWATGEPQKALIAAVKKVTDEPNWKRAYTFAQPYGATAADPEMVMAKMYSELGDPPLLLGADFLYLPKVEQLFSLLQIEATRLQSTGDPAGAMALMVQSLYLGRQMADRQFTREKAVGMQAMTLSLMRIRDIAYVDMKSGAPKLTPDVIRETILKLREPDGILGLERIQLPQGELIGGEQLLSRIMTPRGGTNPEVFGSTLARIGTKDRPLRLFSEQAKWDALAKIHAGDLESREQLKDVFGDWEARWDRDPFDPLMKLPTDYSKFSKTRFAAIDAFVRDVSVLFPLRAALRAEAAGTRTALGVYGYWRQQSTFPPSLTGVSPLFVKKLDIDPYNSDKSSNLQYFIPMRNQSTDPKNPGKPHDFLASPELVGRAYEPFALSLRDDMFVVYSVGPKGSRGGLKRATQSVTDDQGDYLVWPPMLSLVRQNQVESGRLK